ncbi:MAG: hypothetical protein ACI825_001877, partial [Planctomycetota bacterium]
AYFVVKVRGSESNSGYIIKKPRFNLSRGFFVFTSEIFWT